MLESQALEGLEEKGISPEGGPALVFKSLLAKAFLSWMLLPGAIGCLLRGTDWPQ